jgi:hypothetical protein
VQVDWSRPTGTLSVVIPANAVAEVHLPKRDATESGHPLTAADGLRVLRPEGDGVVVEAGSGKYVFAGL